MTCSKLGTRSANTTCRRLVDRFATRCKTVSPMLESKKSLCLPVIISAIHLALIQIIPHSFALRYFTDVLLEDQDSILTLRLTAHFPSQRFLESRGFSPGTLVSSHRKCWQGGLVLAPNWSFHRSCAPWSDMSHKVAVRGVLKKPSTESGWAASFGIQLSSEMQARISTLYPAPPPSTPSFLTCL